MRFLFSSNFTLSITSLIALLITSDLLANSCNKADIDYYLQRGFTHPQVVQLCSTSPASVTSVQQRQPPATVTTPAPSHGVTKNIETPSNPQNPGINNAEQLYFTTVLNATSANIDHSALSYTSKECVEYGEENLTGIKDKVCANTKITIQLSDLEIIRANKGIFLIREQELLVKGNIQREYLNINSLSAGKQAELRLHLPTNPSQLNLPVSKGIDPKQVAARLNKFI